MEGYIAEVRLFAGNFAPRNWAYCEGQLLAINTHQSLFSLIGTTYGGDGRTTFALPDSRSRVVLGAGNGPGLPTYILGQKGGVESVTITQNQMPTHNHLLSSSNLHGTVITPFNADSGDKTDPTNNHLAIPDSGALVYNPSPDAAMDTSTITITGTPTAHNTGGTQAHTNIQPINTLHYIICLTGIYPSRN